MEHKVGEMIRDLESRTRGERVSCGEARDEGGTDSIIVRSHLVWL